MNKYLKEWEAMIIAIDNFTNRVEEDRIDNIIEDGASEEELEELEYELENLQGAANDINDRFKFKSYD